MFHPRQGRNQVCTIRQRERTPPRLMRLESDEDSGCKNTCRDHFVQYLLNTTLHGLKYVGDNTITCFERLFFGFMTLLVFFASVYFIGNVWYKYYNTPIIITLSPKSFDIRQLPFPDLKFYSYFVMFTAAVTICNMNQGETSIVGNIPSDNDDDSMIQNLCTHRVDENVTNSKNGKWSDFETVFMKTSQPCGKMLIHCSYGGFEFNCTDIFVTVLTDDGMCCTFNGVNKKFIAKSQNNDAQELNTSEFLDATAIDWTPEKGFTSEELKLNRSSYPRHVAGTGTNLGLTVVLDTGISENYCSSTVSYGFKALLHNPHEAVKLSTYASFILLGYESRIAIQPTISEATDAIRKLPINIRQCRFEEENFLTYYRTYSRGNCQMECTAKIYLSYCKCILYYMPRFDDNITICGLSDEACVDHVASQIQMRKNNSFRCGCLPGCFEITYDTEISTAPLLRHAPFFSKHGLNAPNISVVHMYFKNMYFRSEKREELIGFTEFLSNTGGLLSLFMGFSVFSIIEVFYFLTIRPYTTHAKVSQRRRFKRIVRKFKSRATASVWMAHMEMHDNNIVYPYVS